MADPETKRQAATLPADVITDQLIQDVRTEMDRAVAENGEFHSIHEGWAVIKEEHDELWDIVKQKRHKRDPKEIRQECIQIAASALKTALTFGE